MPWQQAGIRCVRTWGSVFVSSSVHHLVVLSLLACPALAAVRAAVVEKPDFNRDIRPVLASKCYACHGSDDDKREAGLRLDVRAEAVKEAIKPGRPEKSGKKCQA